MIKKRFVSFNANTDFVRELNAGNIDTRSIVFVLDKQFIYSHGQYFYCDFSKKQIEELLEDEEKIIAEALSDIREKVDINEKITASALSNLASTKIGKDELDIEEIKADINATGSSVINNAQSSLSAALATLNARLQEADLDGMIEDIKALDILCATALTEIKESVETNEQILSSSINELKQEIKKLKEQISS